MRRNLLGLRELDASEIERLLALAERCGSASPRGNVLTGHTVATFFCEPSTRTEISFDLAARRLGAHTVRCDVERSSVKKGESLIDTVRTLEALGADVIVLRHPAAGAAHLVSRWVNCAVVNAGDGMHEHPTQGLVDLLTVRRTLGRIGGLRVAIVGDILHSRVARSAVWGFTKLGASVTLVGPATLLPSAGPESRVPSPWYAYGLRTQDPAPVHPSHESRVTNAGPDTATIRLTTSLEEGLEDADVVMALRMQRERQEERDLLALGEYTRGYGITAELLRRVCPQAILMHPGPMNLGVEVRADAAYGPQSVINVQVRYGVGVRMATLLWVLGLEETIVDRRSSIVERAPAQSPRPLRSARPVALVSSTPRQRYAMASLWAQDGETVDAMDAKDARDAIDARDGVK